MSDSVFIDTSVLVYLYSADEPEKKRRAEATIIRDNSWTSAHCLSELAVALRGPFGLDFQAIQSVVEELKHTFRVAAVSATTVQDALRLARRYRYDYNNGLTLAAALEQHCGVLYSEQLHSGQRIDKRLVIHNPFVGLTRAGPVTGQD